MGETGGGELGEEGRARRGEQKGKRNESRRGHGGKWNEKKGDDGLTDRRRLRAERAFPWALFAVHPFTGCSTTLFSQVCLEPRAFHPKTVGRISLIDSRETEGIVYKNRIREEFDYETPRRVKSSAFGKRNHRAR